MKTLTQNSKNHGLKISCSMLLLFVMTFGLLAQEAASDERSDILDKEGMNKINTVHDKSTPIMLNVVGGGARIHGLTVGRGGGNNVHNSAFGDLALSSNTTGDRNTAIGSYALRYNSTGRYNTAIGRYTLYYNSSGSYNIALGVVALENNKTGNHNIAIGYETCARNSSGYSNIGIGSRALYRNTDRSNLVAVGDSALFNNGMNVTEAFHATGNTALGSKVLFANTTGYRNTGIGYQALYYNTAGYYNTAAGTGALINNTTGYRNTAIGQGALQNNNTQIDNTAVGYGAGFSYIGNYCTYLGVYAHANAWGYSNTTGIGYYARPTGSNQVRIGNSSVTSIGGHAAWSNVSDERFKNNIEENVAGLDFILKLRPVTYNLEVDKLAKHLKEDIAMDESDETAEKSFDSNMKARAEKSAIRYTGFLATEVEAAAKSIGYDFSGVDAPQNAESLYSLRYAEFVVPIVKAIQEQQEQIETLSPEGIDALQSELAALRAENQLMRGQINDIISLLENLGVDVRQSTGPGTSNSQQQSTQGSPRLEQNTPNPFHENTVIRYFLPEGTHRAQILITDMAGLPVMSLPLEHQGAGQVLIHGGTLPSGTYVYTLTVDGRKVDSKRMVLL